MTVRNKASGLANARIRAKRLKPILEDIDGDYYVAHIDYPNYHTFEMNNQSGEILRGVYYADTKTGYTFLERHQVVEDVESTTEHENLHAAIFQCEEWELDDLEDGKMLEKDLVRVNDRTEHNIIRILLWESEYFGDD